MNEKLVDVPHCCWQIFHPVQAVEGEDLGEKMYSMVLPLLWRFKHDQLIIDTLWNP